MKIGVLELISDTVLPPMNLSLFNLFVTRQSASIMPQVVSVWCRQMGHDVSYAAFYGQKDPLQLLPRSLDVVFISCFSRGSGLAYALARCLKMENKKIITILGGPHARQFSSDALRFFDVVVKACDRQLIKEILTDLPKKQVVTTHRTLMDIPSVEERLPEIQQVSFWKKRPTPWSFIPVLSSIGCPFSCDFCVDWKSPYHPLPLDRLKADLTFCARYLPGVKINFYDPNFGINFNEVMSIIEAVDHPKKRWFLTEGSLKTLTQKRLARLKNAGCLCVIPGIESWHEYTNKSGVKKNQSAWDKLQQVTEHFKLIHRYIPIIQANLMFGLDTDKGDEPMHLNQAFISQTPYVAHSLNIPTPFGHTPLFERYIKEKRLLSALPFAFYAKPYLATTLRHYDPIEFYERLTAMFVCMTGARVRFKAVGTTKSILFKCYHPIRHLLLRRMIGKMRQITTLLKTDSSFYRFHEGSTLQLPEYYHREYERRLGRYSQLICRKERMPFFDHPL
jgi:hypothetical protein